VSFRPYAPPTLPSALRAFLSTEPYQFPERARALAEKAALIAVIGSPGVAPPAAPDYAVESTLPYVPPSAMAEANVTAQLPAVQSVYESTRYGEAQVFPVQYAGAGSQLVLQRPQGGKRTLLIIVNDLAVGVIRVCFDANATAALGVPIAAGGNMFLDAAVPQQNVFVFSPNAGQVTVCYQNSPIPS